MVSSKQRRRYWLVLAVLVLALYVIVPQFGSFRSSWHLLRHPRLEWVLMAVLATSLTYLAATTNYWLLALKPIRYGRTLVVQLAVMFVNRLLPSGIGGLGANYAYLRRQGHSAAQAATVAAVNNSLGFIGHGLLLIIALSLATTDSDRHHRLVIAHWLPGLMLVLLASLAGWLFWRRRFIRLLRSIASQILEYSHRPWRLSAALASSMVLTLGNVLALAACCLALGVHLSFVSILLVFTLGISAGSAVPTPGGLGGFEAGLAAGLIADQVASSSALAIALLFRLVTYWLPLLPGSIALWYSQHRNWLSIS